MAEWASNAKGNAALTTGIIGTAGVGLGILGGLANTCCTDNAIVNYVNATFYPKMVADVTTGTETTAQSLFDPIPKFGCNSCGC